MATLNEKPVRLLMQDMAASMGLKFGQVFSREQAVQWFAEHYPNVKQGTVAAHLIRLSTNIQTRLQYSPRSDGSDDKFFKIDSSHFRLYEPGRDPTPISELTPEVEDSSEPAPESSAEFAYEHDLRDYLARNLHIIEPSLKLYLITTMIQPFRTTLKGFCSGGLNHGQKQGSISKKHEHSYLYSAL